MKRVDPVLTTRARARKEMSPGEARLWLRLKSKQIGAPFTRQLPVGRYILDLACRSAKLAVEIDGDTHAAKIAYDQSRDTTLATLGWRTLRVSEGEAANRPDDVVSTIAVLLDDHAHTS